jgi:hypothetical protein
MQYKVYENDNGARMYIKGEDVDGIGPPPDDMCFHEVLGIRKYALLLKRTVMSHLYVLFLLLVIWAASLWAGGSHTVALYVTVGVFIVWFLEDK